MYDLYPGSPVVPLCQTNLFLCVVNSLQSLHSDFGINTDTLGEVTKHQVRHTTWLLGTYLKLVPFLVVLDAIVVGQLHYKVVVLLPVPDHGLAPLPIVGSVHGAHPYCVLGQVT